MRRSQCLRFESDAELAAAKRNRRERFAHGQVSTLERDVLASVLELVQKHPAVAFAVRNNVGVGYLLRVDQFRRLVASGHLKPDEARFMRFGFKGAADVTGMLRGGKRLEIECKSDSGTVTDDQQRFLDAVNGGGGLGLVARSIDDVLRAIA